MARRFLTAIDLTKNELQNAAVQNLASAPSSPVKGQLYYNSTGGDDTLYWYNGTGWVAAKGGAGAVPATTVTTQAVGDAAVVGVATNYAREDHKHGREAFGAAVADTAFGSAKVDGVATTIARSDHIHGNPVHDAAAHATIPLSALAVPTGPVSFNNQKITSLADPTATTDAANKNYVDSLVNGLSWKQSVRVASTGNEALSGSARAIDGVTIGVATRILLKNQTNATENGIYVSAAGAWARATDLDNNAEFPNATVYVQEGTTQADTAWTCTNDSTMAIGTTNVVFIQSGGPGVVTAGAGLTQSGNTLNVIGDTSITVAADSISRAALTGDVTAPAGSNATTIAANAVDNTKAADIPANRIKGNNTGATADPLDLTGTQVTAMLDQFSSTLKGLVPLSGGGILNFLRADGAWAAAAAGTVRAVSANCAAALTTTVTHNFGFRTVGVTVYRNSTPWDTVETDVERPDANSIVVRFAVAPAAADYVIVVFG